jgi:hypothetical protein
MVNNHAPCSTWHAPAVQSGLPQISPNLLDLG